MEVFSLEDDDFNELFITQESKDLVEEKPKQEVNESGAILGLDLFDFASPCSSVVKRQAMYEPQTSDVSDDDFTEKIVMDSKSGK